MLHREAHIGVARGAEAARERRLARYRRGERGVETLEAVDGEGVEQSLLVAEVAGGCPVADADIARELPE